MYSIFNSDVMPGKNGIKDALLSTIRTDIHTELSRIFLQVDPVEMFCTGNDSPAMSFPELLVSGQNAFGFGFILAGVFLLFIVATGKWGVDKMSNKTTAGGKAAAFAGFVFLFAGIMAFQVDDAGDQFYEGSSQCFTATATPVEYIDAALLTVTALL